MTQTQRRQYLIKALLKEQIQYKYTQIPADETQQKMLLRALFNTRPPMDASADFLKLQDEYLQEEIRAKGITDAAALAHTAADARLCIWQGDITLLKADAIVNAANSGLTGCYRPNHACIDNAIHTFAGVQLRYECGKIMDAQGHAEYTGTAKITPAYNLPSKYVLHTVGPIVQGELTPKHRAQLAGCYKSCLALAAENGAQSVAFCCISTGVFGFPQQPAAEIAVKTVKEFLDTSTQIKRVVFNVFQNSDYDIYRAILGADTAP